MTPHFAPQQSGRQSAELHAPDAPATPRLDDVRLTAESSTGGPTASEREVGGAGVPTNAGAADTCARRSGSATSPVSSAVGSEPGDEPEPASPTPPLPTPPFAGDDGASTPSPTSPGNDRISPPPATLPGNGFGGAAHWLDDDPALHEPTMVVVLNGWIDAAGAADRAMQALKSAAEASPILRFDDDTFIDYRARRPVMELRDGINTNLVWETIELSAGHVDGHDVVLLSGPEPDMAWHRFCRIVSTAATQLGVRHMVGFGAYPFAAPHTRPARLSVSSPSTEMLARVPYARSSIDVPAGAAAALEHALHAAKIPTIGLWAQVPHYISGLEYAAASVALLDGLREVTGVDVAAPSLRAAVAEQRTRLDEMVADNHEHLTLVHQLEELYDATLADDQAAGDAAPDDGELEMRSGDEIADEIQRFLRGD